MTEPRCRLYLIAPDPLPPDFAAILADALEGGDVAALRVAAGDLDDAAFLEALQPIRRVAHEAGVAVILANRPDLAVRAACDGAHLEAEPPTLALRKQLGDLQLGAWCGASRDVAMQAGEAGADYVTFGPFDGSDDAADPELVSWWVELMELPAVVEGGITLENCATPIGAGADFVAVGAVVWRHEAGPGPPSAPSTRPSEPMPGRSAHDAASPAPRPLKSRSSIDHAWAEGPTRPRDRFFRAIYWLGFRVLRGYWFLRRPNHRGALVALWVRNRILMLRLSYRKGLCLPGGGIERGETAEQAALRELREEPASNSSPPTSASPGGSNPSGITARITSPSSRRSWTSCRRCIRTGREVIEARLITPLAVLAGPAAPFIRSYLLDRLGQQEGEGKATGPAPLLR